MLGHNVQTGQGKTTVFLRLDKLSKRESKENNLCLDMMSKR